MTKQKIAAARAARTPPPRPRPRTPEETAAVEILRTTECPGSPVTRIHLIPSTSTICLRCAADAMRPALDLETTHIS